MRRIEQNWLILVMAFLFFLVCFSCSQTPIHSHDEDALSDHEDHDHEGIEDNDHYDDAAREENAHQEDEHESILTLSDEQLKRLKVEIRRAGPGKVFSQTSLTGEVVFNQDRVVHLVPRVAGIARKVYKSVGERVREGELLAVIDSRELADAKAEYIAAKARAALSEKIFLREKDLFAKQASSEEDFLLAEQALSESEIQFKLTEQKLFALGLSVEAVALLGQGHMPNITRYEVFSPTEGVVTQKHIALGETLAGDTTIYTIADTRSVWVHLTVYTKDLANVHPEQDVLLRVDHNGGEVVAQIAMVTPFVEESTRSATARVVLDNPEGKWVPGTFVTGVIASQEITCPVVVPRIAVQNIDGEDVVFVPQDGGYEITHVSLGRNAGIEIEIVAGLAPGTPYVTEGAFELKATHVTSQLDAHAGHGH